MKKIIAVLLSIITILLSFVGCAGKKPVPKEDFRITAYLVAGGVDENFDASHFSQLTDLIVFGLGYFGEDGKISFDERTDFVMNIVKSAAEKENPSLNIYLNLLGPGNQSDSDDWNEQMYDQGMRHTNAFKSGIFEEEIKNAMEKYGFNGVFFDYEYPLKKEHWKAFDEFLISLDQYLGDEYKIGAAISAWNSKQSKDAMKACDMVEVMAYDMWDKKGNHSTMRHARQTMSKMVRMGYDRKQLDLGIPFYGRPTTKDGYWYGYNGSCDHMDENGLSYDEETGLTFSFNTQELVAEKTRWAMDKGYGGIMVWHYGCDVPADNEKSLFTAAYNEKMS